LTLAVGISADLNSWINFRQLDVLLVPNANRSIRVGTFGYATDIRYPRPIKGIFVAITVMNWTFASSGREAMYTTASATCRASIRAT